jgi:hypothetical protein
VWTAKHGNASSWALMFDLLGTGFEQIQTRPLRTCLCVHLPRLWAATTPSPRESSEGSGRGIAAAAKFGSSLLLLCFPPPMTLCYAVPCKTNALRPRCLQRL